MEAAATVRLRAVFSDRSMLSKSQRRSGLNRSWLLLKPEHRTVSDLASHVLEAFELHRACSNGIVLSMDGFVLPPFESTCILKDGDVISVSKRRRGLSGIEQLGDVENSLEVEVVEKQFVHAGLKLLANEEFGKESRGYDESEMEEDGDDQSEDAPQVEVIPAKNKTSKKRKARKELRSPKSKKSKRATVEEHIVDGNFGNDVLAKNSKSSRRDGSVSKKKLAKKNKSRIAEGEQDKLNASDSEIDERSNDSSESSLDAKRLDENGQKHVDASQTPGEIGKVPSRSARRKKAKRQWLRLANQEKKELAEKQIPHHDNQQSADKDNDIVSETHQQPSQNSDAPCKVVHVSSDKHQESDQNGDAEECYVPVVIRPGHIRFKPLGEDADDDVQQNNQAPKETFQWNGITSKKKGQKWGMEKQSYSKRNDYRNPSPESSESSEMVIAEEGLPANDPLDFDKLAPYTSLPKEGDVIAYRLIELSSSWTPELSSFRVGKISRYDSDSNNILLEPVPEYPIVLQKEIDEEESELQIDMSLYAEDGKLEINFLSLLDIRSVKGGNSDSTQAVPAEVEIAQSDHNANADSSKKPVPAQENGNVWEELSQALTAKKAQLSRADDSSKEESSGRRSSSYRGLRSSALGPVVSVLRAQNKL